MNCHIRTHTIIYKGSRNKIRQDVYKRQVLRSYLEKTGYTLPVFWLVILACAAAFLDVYKRQLDVHGNDLAGIHVQKILQQLVTQVRSRDIQEADRPEDAAHLKGCLLYTSDVYKRQPLVGAGDFVRLF